MSSKKIINQFDTEWSEFSNFACSTLSYQGIEYPTAEHAFQAAKVLDPVKKEIVRCARTPGEAKIFGNLYKDRDNWVDIKIQVMTDILRCKFSQNKYLADQLLSTDDAHLEEGNSWGDVFWGTCDGRGLNHLGSILMLIREELRSGTLKVRDPNPTFDQIPADAADFKLNHPYSRKS